MFKQMSSHFKNHKIFGDQKKRRVFVFWTMVVAMIVFLAVGAALVAVGNPEYQSFISAWINFFQGGGRVGDANAPTLSAQAFIYGIVSFAVAIIFGFGCLLYGYHVFSKKANAETE